MKNNNIEPAKKKKRRINEVDKRHNENLYFDLWESGDNVNEKEVVENETKNPFRERGYVMTLTKKVRPITRIMPSEIEAVEIINPGGSYNPSVEEHGKLLKEAYDEQMIRRKEFKTVMDQLKKDPKEKNAEPMKEFDIGGDDSFEEDDDSEEKEHISVEFVPRLTQAQINKKKRRKIHEAIVEKHKKLKELKKQNLSQAQEEDKEEKKKIEDKKKERKLKKEKYKNNTKRLGKEKIPEKDIEVLLTDELPSSLRELNPKTSLIEDRFYSLQRRNIIEPRRIKDYERRYKMKLTYNIRQKEFINEQNKKYLSDKK